MSVPSILPSTFLSAIFFHEVQLHVDGLLAVAQLHGRVEQVAQSYTLPQTSGTPRSMFSRV